MESPPNTPQIDIATLRGVVRRILGIDQIAPLSWTCTPLHIGSSGGQTFLVRDAANVGAWAVVLKVSRRDDGEADEQDSFFWLRETRIYESGLLRSTQNGPVAPDFVGVTFPIDEEVWLWLEALDDARKGQRWAIADFDCAARRIGELNGSYLVRPPTKLWLTRELLRRWVQNLSDLTTSLDEFATHPDVRRALPAQAEHQVRALVPFAAPLLDVLRKLPQSFCHLDSHKRNIVLVDSADGQTRAVLIDWALAGLGAVGQDLGPLITVSAFMFEAEGIALDELDAVAFDAYVSALQGCGWLGDVRIVRIGYVCDAILRFLNRTRFLVGIVKHEDARLWWERVSGRCIDDSFDQYRSMLDYMLRLANEAIEYTKMH